MASGSIIDVWGWIRSLPPVNQWKTKDPHSLNICTSQEANQSLNLLINKSSTSRFNFSIFAESYIPIALWTSNSFQQKATDDGILDEETMLQFFFNIISGVLKYGHNIKSPFRESAIQICDDFDVVFNVAFLNLVLLVCIYEVPSELRCKFVVALRMQLTSSSSKEASKQLMRVLGSNLEELWMRSLNLGITNWIIEVQDTFMSPSPLFSYALSASRLWKVQLYCPIVAMSLEYPSSTLKDKRLQFSLNYQQFESVIQLSYKLIFNENWIDVMVNVDNIRCDINQLVSEDLMAKQGYGSEEKHFLSRICLQLTPTLQSDILSVSVNKSTENPIHEIGLEKGFEGSLQPPTSMGLSVSASESITMSLKPWRFEQSVYGDSTILNWFLHDGANGKEVFSCKPRKLALWSPRSWFRNRYTSAYRPFTRQGGVIFAGDEYGESVCWKVCEEAIGKTMEWEIRGRIWLTYWPNKRRNCHSETRRLEFRESLYLTIEK
ncbi:uncharacterized protein [Typha latifolia]|uniref:uncharacterized protein n=1 Tax=Typha latifolia TaxID=4733 RepID=UPI003C30E1F0